MNIALVAYQTGGNSALKFLKIEQKAWLMKKIEQNKKGNEMSRMMNMEE